MGLQLNIKNLYYKILVHIPKILHSGNEEDPLERSDVSAICDKQKNGQDRFLIFYPANQITEFGKQIEKVLFLKVFFPHWTIRLFSTKHCIVRLWL
jgi:hypothetical protein